MFLDALYYPHWMVCTHVSLLSLVALNVRLLRVLDLCVSSLLSPIRTSAKHPEEADAKVFVRTKPLRESEERATTATTASAAATTTAAAGATRGEKTDGKSIFC